MKQLIEQVERTKTRSATRRVADFLLKLTPKGADKYEITLPYGKSLIAIQLAMTLESFSRALQSLKPLGIVVNREIVTVDNCQALANFVTTGDRIEPYTKSRSFMFDPSN